MPVLIFAAVSPAQRQIAAGQGPSLESLSFQRLDARVEDGIAHLEVTVRRWDTVHKHVIDDEERTNEG